MALRKYKYDEAELIEALTRLTLITNRRIDRALAPDDRAFATASHIYECHSSVDNSLAAQPLVAWLTRDAATAKRWSQEAGVWNEVQSWDAS